MLDYYYLSQGDLNLLAVCPPQFEQKYLRQKNAPHHLQYQKNTQWGREFHLLMQQYNLGLNIEEINDRQQTTLDEAKALIQKTENIWHNPHIIFREAEYQVNYTYQNYVFTAIYDLLIFTKNQATIVDWKTYRQPQNTKKLLNNWQTKLYLYLLAKKFDYPLEQISFVYWFISSSQKIESFTINYDDRFHRQVEQELMTLLRQFEHLISDYYTNDMGFPHHDNCQKCPYRENFPDVQENNDDSEEIIMTWDEIEPIEI